MSRNAKLLLAACFATTLALAQTPTAPAAGPYPIDPANGGTKATPANSGNTVPVAAPPNAAADAKAEAKEAEKPKGPVRLSSSFMAGQIFYKVPPKYPAEARAKGISGSAVLHALIGKDGVMKNVTVVSGPELLQNAALDAVKNWVYRPYLLNGEPTEVDTTIMVNFNINSPKDGPPQDHP